MSQCVCGCGREVPVEGSKFFSRSCVLRAFLQDERFVKEVGREHLEEALRVSETMELVEASGRQRKCDTQNCDNDAQYHIVWTKPQFYCRECVMRALALVETMGFPTPRATLRLMTVDEMMGGE